MKLSVCIATYNGEKYIQEQLLSILHQLDKNDEVIVSDDSSSDRTIEIIKAFKDERVIIYPNQKFRNPALNFENAIKKSSGDIIFLSDQDDIWEDDKVNVMRKYLLDYDLVLSDCRIIDSENKVIGDSFFEIRGSHKGVVNNLYKNSYIGCCMAFRKSLMDVFIPFPKGIYMHDWWIGITSEIYGKVFFCEDKLVRYRRHENNASPTGERVGYSPIVKLKNRLGRLGGWQSHTGVGLLSSNLSANLFEVGQTRGGQRYGR